MPLSLNTKIPPVAFLIFVIALQIAAVVVVFFVPMGFDKPSSWGLHYDHFLLVVALYCGAFPIGIVMSVKQRRGVALLLQLLIPVVVYVLVCAGIVRI